MYIYLVYIYIPYIYIYIYIYTHHIDLESGRLSSRRPTRRGTSARLGPDLRLRRRARRLEPHQQGSSCGGVWAAVTVVMVMIYICEKSTKKQG